MNQVLVATESETPNWVSYAALLVLVLAIPAGCLWLYIAWSGDVIREGALALMRQGAMPDSMDKIPGWNLVFAVGKWAPLVILGAISWPVWKQSSRVRGWFGILSRVCLGLMWGWYLF